MQGYYDVPWQKGIKGNFPQKVGMSHKIPSRRKGRKSRMRFLHLVVPVGTLEANNLVLQIRSGKDGPAQSRGGLVGHALEIGQMGGWVVRENGFFGGCLFEHANANGVPVFQERHVGVGLHEPLFAVP